jgi:hypothetical protein
MRGTREKGSIPLLIPLHEVSYEVFSHDAFVRVVFCDDGREIKGDFCIVVGSRHCKESPIGNNCGNKSWR